SGISFPLNVSISIVHAVAADLETSHAQGLLRDSVPAAYVVIDLDTGGIRVADFDTTDNRTPGGAIYLAPEQVVTDGAVSDHRSEVYTLGLLAYGLTAGRRAFGAGDTAT